MVVIKSKQRAPRGGRERKAPATGRAGWQRVARHTSGITVLSGEFEYVNDDLACYPALVSTLIPRSKHP